MVDQPIDHIEAGAVVTTDGQRRPADVLIFGTGFSTTDFLAHIPVTGEGGRTLAEEWSDGAHAYLGTAVPGFPNCYFLYGPNTNLGHNSILFMVERQINLILQAMAVQTRSLGTATAPLVEVAPEAYRRDDHRTQSPDGHHRMGGRLHELVQERLRAGDQQLAHLDLPLLVRHPAPAAGDLGVTGGSPARPTTAAGPAEMPARSPSG